MTGFPIMTLAFAVMSGWGIGLDISVAGKRPDGRSQADVALPEHDRGDALALDGWVGKPDGTLVVCACRRGGAADALGGALAENLIAPGADRILAECEAVTSGSTAIRA